MSQRVGVEDGVAAGPACSGVQGDTGRLQGLQVTFDGPAGDVESAGQSGGGDGLRYPGAQVVDHGVLAFGAPQPVPSPYRWWGRCPVTESTCRILAPWSKVTTSIPPTCRSPLVASHSEIPVSP